MLKLHKHTREEPSSRPGPASLSFETAKTGVTLLHVQNFKKSFLRLKLDKVPKLHLKHNKMNYLRTMPYNIVESSG